MKRRAPEHEVDQLVPQERVQIRRGAVSKENKCVPQERVQLSTRVEGADVPVGVAMKPVLQERVVQRTDEQLVDEPAPRYLDDLALLVPQERKQQRVLSKLDILVDTGDKLVPQERVQTRTVGQVDVPALECADDAGKLVPHERVQSRIVGQVDVPAPGYVDDAEKLVPQERE